jgi:NADH dehydrogenase [ubiquinone] 1 alpha subcomplex assembly factor 7
MMQNLESFSQELKRHIALTGPVTVEDYMAYCLGASGGYYRDHEPIGRSGDFITAPEISQCFGELIGLWAAAVWQTNGRRPVKFVELGPGRGVLMADILRAAQAASGFSEAIEVWLVEISEALRRHQATALARWPNARPQWRERLEDVPDGPAIIIANEFLDALPIRQLERREGAWWERRVGLGPDGAFVFLTGEQVAWPTDYPVFPDPDLAEGEVVEICPKAAKVAVELARRARQTQAEFGAGGMTALFIDYGCAKRAAGDSLQAVARHRYADSLANPGEADLSAHVDFEAFGACALAAGLNVWGPMPQGQFLLRLGLGQRLERLSRDAAPKQKEALLSGAQRLVDPKQMGVLFKVMAVTAPGAIPPPPFTAS